MKSAITEAIANPAGPFPKLMESTETGSIYLLTTVTCGIKVANGPDGFDGFHVGHYSNAWASHMKDFHGTVTLSND